MSTTEIHCCETKNCNGSKYMNCSLNCRFCKKKIYIECLRNRDESRTKQLLLVFGLMSKTLMSDGDYQWQILSSNPTKLAEFFQMFNVDSSFGVTCDVCDQKFSLLQQSHHTNINSANIEHQSTSRLNINTSSDSMNFTQMLPSKISVYEKQIVLPTEDADGLFVLYVSKSDTSSTTDSLVSFIMEKTDISPDVFKVVSLSSSRKSRRTYTAFKVIAFTHDVCQLLCKSEIWTSEYRVRPFARLQTQKNKHVKKSNSKTNGNTNGNTSKNDNNNNNRSSKVRNDNSIQNKRNSNNKNNNSNKNHIQRNNYNQRFRKQNNKHHWMNDNYNGNNRMGTRRNYVRVEQQRNTNSNHRQTNFNYVNGGYSNEPHPYYSQYAPQSISPSSFWYHPPHFVPPIQYQGIPSYRPQPFQTFALPQMSQPFNIHHQG